MSIFIDFRVFFFLKSFLESEMSSFHLFSEFFLFGRQRSPLFRHVVLDLVVVRLLCEWQPTARSMAASLNASSTISLRTSSPEGHEGVAMLKSQYT